MRKFKFVFVVVVLLLTLALASGCNADDAEYTLKLNTASCASFYDEGVAAYVFAYGSVDWSVFNFYVYDASGSVVDTKTVTASMVSSLDLLKVSAPGINTVTVNYQGAKLFITIQVLPKDEVIYRSITFNAGVGYFPGKEDECEYDNDGNLTYRKIYENGEVDVLEQPVRAGYDFVGWYTEPDFVGSKVVTPYKTSRNIMLYAKWSDQRKYSIQYISYLEDRYDTQIAKYDGVEHGTTVNLVSAPSRKGYIFKGYYVVKAGEQYDPVTTPFIAEDSENLSLVLECDITVRLYYEVKNIKLTFVSEYWNEGDVVCGQSVVYKENVAVLGGDKYISGGCYIIDVPYETILHTDEDPVPIFPEIVSSTGSWVDVATNKSPEYGKVTEDMIIAAVYEVKKFTMYFFMDENFSVPATDVGNNQVKRTAEYGQKVETLPVVPEVEGHRGVWQILDGTSFVEVDLNQIEMVKDINVCAKYMPIDYNVKFVYKLPDSSVETIYAVTYPYDSVIEAPSLVEYYDEKHYTIEWYANRSLDTLIDHTAIVVKGDVSYYFKPVENDYIVHFIVADFADDNSYTIVYQSKYVVHPGSQPIVPPQINFTSDSPMFGYDVVGWRCRKNIVEYDPDAVYALNTIVLYKGSLYSYKKVSSNRIAPDDYGAGEFWQSATESSWASDVGTTGIEITDFHEYNENILYDKAYYAVTRIREYSVNFMNMNITGSAAAGYTNEYYSVNYRTLMHGERLIDDIGDINDSLVAPEYPNPEEIGDFVFEGWYIDSEFTTLKVDFSNPYNFTSDTIFYAKWTDKKKGTDGLVYELVSESVAGVPRSYYVVTGFRPNLPEYSYVDLRIPDFHDGIEVKGIAEGAFNDFSKIYYITSVALGANIEEIGDNAFASLFELESFILENNDKFVYDEGVLYSADRKVLYRVVPTHTGESFELPDSVEIIRGGAFSYCKQLYTFGATVTSELTEIGPYAFSGCSGLRNVFIPDNVVEIGDYAFRGCYNISSMTGGKNLIKVGMGVFNSLIDTLESDDEYICFGDVLIKYIGTDMHVTLDPRIKAIAAGAFAEHDNLITFVASSDSALKYIGNCAFQGAFVLNSIKFECSDKVDAAIDAFDRISLSCLLYVNSDLLDAYKADAAYQTAFTNDNAIIPL